MHSDRIWWQTTWIYTWRLEVQPASSCIYLCQHYRQKDNEQLNILTYWTHLNTVLPWDWLPQNIWPSCHRRPLQGREVWCLATQPSSESQTSAIPWVCNSCNLLWTLKGETLKSRVKDHHRLLVLLSRDMCFQEKPTPPILRPLLRQSVDPDEPTGTADTSELQQTNQDILRILKVWKVKTSWHLKVWKFWIVSVSVDNQDHTF